MALSPRKLKVGDLVVIKFGPKHNKTVASKFKRAGNPLVGKWYTGEVTAVAGPNGCCLEIRVTSAHDIWIWTVVDSADPNKFWSDATVVRKVSHA